MFDRHQLQRIWDHSHHMKPASEQPEENIVAFAAHLQECLPPQTLLLDIGCGRGRNTLYLSRLGFSVYGCDLSPVALETAIKRAQQVGLPLNFQICDLACLPYADDSFAVVICVHVLPYHLKTDIVKGIHEIWRVVKPNGHLFVDFLDRDDAEYGCGQKLEENTFLDSDGVPVHFCSWQEISELVNGFTVERATRQELKSSFPRMRVTWTVRAVKCREEHRVVQT